MHQDVHFFTFVVPERHAVVVTRFVRSPVQLDTTLVYWENDVLVGGLTDSIPIDTPVPLKWNPEVTSPLATPSMTVCAAPQEPGWVLTVPAGPASLELRLCGPAFSYPELAGVQADANGTYIEHPGEARVLDASGDTRGIALHGYQFGQSAMGESWHWAFGTTDDGSHAFNLYRITDPAGRRLTGGWLRVGDEFSRVNAIEPIPASRRTATRQAIVVHATDFSITVEYEFHGQVLLASPFPDRLYSVTQQPVHLWIEGRAGYGVEERASDV